MGNKAVLTNDEIMALKVLLAALAEEKKTTHKSNVIDVEFTKEEKEEKKESKFQTHFKALKNSLSAATNKTVEAVKNIPRPQITFVKKPEVAK